MSLKTILISLIALLTFSSCSSSRYGYIPKAKRKKSITKKVVRKPYKKVNKREYLAIAIKQAKPALVKNSDLAIARTPLLQVKALNLKKRTAKKVKSISKYQLQPSSVKGIQKGLKKQEVKQQQKTADSDFWEDVWDDFLFDFLGALALIAIVAFFVWLESIGLGWVVMIIGIALIILVIVLLVKLMEEILDMIFA